MSRSRQNKQNPLDASATNASLNVTSTSPQAPQRRFSHRRTSPFRGFNDNVNQTELVAMNRVLNAIVNDSQSCESDVSKEVPRTTLKEHNTPDITTTNAPPSSSLAPQQRTSRRRSSYFPGFDNNVDQTELVEDDTSKEVLKKKLKIRQIKKIKLDFKSENENSTDLYKKTKAKGDSNCKKSHSLSNKRVSIYTDEDFMNAGNEGKENFLGNESKGGNVINILNNRQRGVFKPSVFDEIAEQVSLKSLRWFRLCMAHETTDLRVTAVAWHPTNANLIVSGGKAGTLVLSRIDEQKLTLVKENEVPGIGPGGTIECIKFNTKASGLEVCTASVDGSIACYILTLEHCCIRKPLVRSVDPYRVWFCTVDVHQDGKSVYGGDSAGNLAIHHLDCGKIEYGSPHLKLHSCKIRHLEFSPRDPNLMVTSSLDKTVKLWDIRKLDGRKSSVESLVHEFGVSAAKFSRTDGCHLLTTDLFSELRVYKAPLWNLEHTIRHPHRHFQHLTIIRASWHPRADLFVVGRYPDPKLKILDDLRSVDVYSASSAKLCHELTDTNKLITSLAEFNSTGSFLATSSGRTVSFWNQRN